MSPGARGATRERIYLFVRERLLAGRPPTVREVQRAVGLKAVESARVHLERLVADGRLEKDSGKARGYRLPFDAPGGGAPALVPLLGRVQAGGLTAAIEEPDGYVAVAGASAGAPGELLALRVSGDSMRDAGILEGDVVIVRRDVTPRSGDVVVAFVGDEATVKTLRFTGPERRGSGQDSPDQDGSDQDGSGPHGSGQPGSGQPGSGQYGSGQRGVALVPANPDFATITPDPADLRLLGRVVEVRRTLDASPGN